MPNTSEQPLLSGIASDALDPSPVPTPLPPADPRLRRADRDQVLLQPCSLEQLLDPDHAARIVWELVGQWDLSQFLAKIAARGEAPGRRATDPRILITLWLFAYTRGISNGRELDRLCLEHAAYRWICGGVSVNYHMLNAFRVDNEEALDGLLTQMIAALLSKNLVKVQRIANDGTRVRASAGRNSFKTAERLAECLKEAEAHVAAVKQQAGDQTMPLKQKRAKERGARQRVARLQQAIIEVKKVQESKDNQKKKPSKEQPAKASTTDPESRFMRMPNGGTDPAHNIQFAVATEGRAIVGVDVTNEGNDVHQSQPMREQVEERTGQKVTDHLVDGGFIGLDSIDQSAAAGTTIYAPVPKPRKEEIDPHEPKKTDSEAVAAWRQLMGTPAAKTIYKERASTVETANGECKTYRGLDKMPVRGLERVRNIALWVALAYNAFHFARQLLA